MYGVFFLLTPVTAFEAALKYIAEDAIFTEHESLILRDWRICKDDEQIEDVAKEFMKEYEADVKAYYFDPANEEFIYLDYSWEDYQKAEIEKTIEGLKDLIKDRESFVVEGEEDSVFLEDIKILKTAINHLEKTAI